MKVRGSEGELSKGVRFLQAVGRGRVSMYMNELEIMAGIYASIFDLQAVKHVCQQMHGVLMWSGNDGNLLSLAKTTFLDADRN